MKHVIGIDFGTSTSMIKTAVRDGKTDSLETRPVIFTQNGYSSVPTLIQKKGDAVWYGWDVDQDKGLDALLYRNFKLSLRSENPQERREAVELLEEFFRYLYQSYAEQKNFLPGGAEEIETIVSYPAQWSREQQELVINAAKKAGFPNVSGMDEPSAAVNCILKAKQKDIEKTGILRTGKALSILVVDMGAGTTDLAFVTVTVENGKLQTVIRGTWPEAGSHVIYGGSQMDLRLEEMMRTWLTDSGLPETMAQNLVKGQRSSIKSWKENTLSALLAKDITADGFSNITSFLNTVGMTAKPFPAINRDSFADLFRAELENFVKVISSVPQNLRDEAELVILTGGNSEWFWIPDVMLGADTRFGDVGLKNLRSNPDRLIRMEQPAETVSRGLVYDQNNISISRILMGPKFSINNFNDEIEHKIEHEKDSVVKYHSKPVTVNVLEVQWDDSKGLWYTAIPRPRGKLREGQTIQILKEYSRLKLSCKLQSLVLSDDDILWFAMKPEGDAQIQVGDPLRYWADIPFLDIQKGNMDTSLAAPQQQGKAKIEITCWGTTKLFSCSHDRIVNVDGKRYIIYRSDNPRRHYKVENAFFGKHAFEIDPGVHTIQIRSYWNEILITEKTVTLSANDILRVDCNEDRIYFLNGHSD